MATRPTKTAGNTTYTAEVAAGATTIKASEVDGDLNEIFANITDVNLAVGANIATAKLANDLGITSGKLGPNSVITSKILDQNVTTAKILTGNSTPSAVATATIIAFTQGAGGESQIVALPPFTPRGGRVFVFGTVAGFMTTTTTLGATATFKLFRDGLQIPNALWTLDMQSEEATLRSVPAPFSLLWTEVPTAAAHTYSLRCAVASGGTAIWQVSSTTNGGMLFAVEFA